MSVGSLFRRLAFWLRRHRAEDELLEELQFHRDMAEGDMRRSGLSDAEAAAASRRAMGNTMLAREEARGVWLPVWIDSVWQDVRHGARGLRRSPSLVAVSALSLGLGIGLNVILYAGLESVFGHEPTLADPDRTVGVEPGNANQFSYLDYTDLLRAGIFEDAAGFRIASVTLGVAPETRRTSAILVTANFFDVLGVKAGRGRLFGPEAGPDRDPRVVVVSADYWRAALNADPAAIGRRLVFNGEAYTLIGVLRDDYQSIVGWIGPSLYIPVTPTLSSAMAERGTPSLSVLATLKPETTVEQAEAGVTAFARSQERIYPQRIELRGRSATVFPAADVQFRGSSARSMRLFAIMARVMVSLVLLIACINVMGLLMARATTRRREIAVRVAVGAGRLRVAQAMLIEGFLLVVIGTAVGLPLAYAIARAPLPRVLQGVQQIVRFDVGLIPFGMLLVAVTTLICGAIPAMRATRGHLISEGRLGGEGVTPRLFLRHSLIVGQVAMSLVLIVASFLCVRSQTLIARTDVGFDIDHGIVARFGLDQNQYAGEARVRFAERLIERISAIPGVRSASMADLVPLGGDSLLRSFHPAGRTDIPGTRPSVFAVGPEYFDTLSIPFVSGRDFGAVDGAGAPAVAIINETFAKTYFPGRAALGQRVQIEDEPDAEVVGVVKDNRIGTIGEAPQSVVYYAFAQNPGQLVLHVRTATAPDGLLTAVARAIDEVDASVPVGVDTLRAATSLELQMRRVATFMMGTMGAVGLLLAVVGLYSVMAQAGAARVVEVGIRMALGASGPRIRQEMLRRALIVVAWGIGVGAIASVAVMPALATFLAGVSPFDPVSFGGGTALLLLVGLAAGYLPARRSASLDPASALRRA
jgi:predicted permease